MIFSTTQREFLESASKAAEALATKLYHQHGERSVDIAYKRGHDVTGVKDARKRLLYSQAYEVLRDRHPWATGGI
jgi:hypothetical protein